MKYLFSIIMLLVTLNSAAAPNAELWSFWDKSNEQNSASISHQPWQQLLDSYLIQRGTQTLFQYSKVTEIDRTKLQNYLADLSKLDPRTFNRMEQYAYWVNLYNALTVNLILDNYPLKSITKLGGIFSFGPWGDQIAIINSKKLTLNDIEHRILRPIWQDPRTHYAVNCASLGCPNLQSSAFTAQNSQVLLDKAASDFINSSKGATLESGKLQLSSIYDWFSSDFGDKEALFRHLAQYRVELNGYSGQVNFDYDWRLNE